LSKIAMAIAAHPDDIEFMMGGTLIKLGEAGYELHYMSIGNGSCGSATMDAEETVRVRTQEARNAAASIGATFHDPLVPDIEILYEQPLIRKLCAIIRGVAPDILLLPSIEDYMEDHSTSSRLGVTAAFCRGMRNYQTDPPTQTIDKDMCLYHALPYGLRDQLRNPVIPGFYVDITDVIDRKRELLASGRGQLPKDDGGHVRGSGPNVRQIRLRGRLENPLPPRFRSGGLRSAPPRAQRSHNTIARTSC